MSLFILTGDRAAGKTTFCRNLCRAVGKGANTLAGILTETERDVALTSFDLRSSEHRCLAWAGNQNIPGSMPGSFSSLRTGRWIFNPATIEWGNLVILNAPPSDLFVLDEAGILEFEGGQGWREGMARIDRQQDRSSLVVVRPELVETALQRWPEAEVLRISRPDIEVKTVLIQKILGCL